MKDAFGNKLSVGDRVIYSTKGGAGTVYCIGTVTILHPCKNEKGKSYTPPDRVTVSVTSCSQKQSFLKDPIVYASNVVLLREEAENES